MTARKLFAVLMLVLCVGFLGSAVASADNGDVTVSATFNGQDIASASTAAPLRLAPGTVADVALAVTNRGTEPVVVQRVQFSGDILGLDFYRYVASTELTVAPGATGTLSYQVDLTDLDRLATGLIRGDLQVSDDAGRVITTIATVTDVQGSLWSVTGLFGLALFALTALAFARVAVAVARHQLPANRAQRGMRFLLPGVGLLLVLGFTASVLRLWTPSAEVWFAALGISAAAFFALGYFSPMPGVEDDDEEDPSDVDYDRLTDQFTEDLASRLSTQRRGSQVSNDEPSDAVTVGDAGQQTRDEAGP